MVDPIPTCAGNAPVLPELPVWSRSGGAESAEIIAFRTGATLAVLDQILSEPALGLPPGLLVRKLALKAAVATSRLEGRHASEADIRDAFHFTAPGAAPGPDGDLLAFWRAGVMSGPTGRDWNALVGPELGEAAPGWMQAGCAHGQRHGPLAGCISALKAVLQADDRAERMACLLSDMVLAHVMNWPLVLPVTARGLTKSMLRNLAAQDEGADLPVRQRILDTLQETTRLARSLARDAARLRAVAPKLRTRGKAAAVDLFLTEDVVAPSAMLSPRIRGSTIPMTDRAARRFCERLVALGVAHELTGRATFRLYGIAQ